ncbi:hypothetical protein DL765_002952 [Monosporascus sp. GIB2]|nr:hypothetical protein DL765_002952 [Monosporascus sp. GIB2]
MKLSRLYAPALDSSSSARSTAGQPSLHLQYLLPRIQRRNAWFGWGSSSSTSASKPLTEELSKRERQQRLMERMVDTTQGQSIFDEEIKGPDRGSKKKKKSKVGGEDGGSAMADPSRGKSFMGPSRVREHMERALDPDPRWRIRYQKKKVMQMVRANGQVSHKELIRRSEKEVESKSTPLPTSTKKLVYLSHQIVGKTVDEAITQMRYSKKKMAREVKYQLEEARDMAIASRGMGLGVPNGEVFDKPKKIQTKDGRWIDVSDPTTLYVDESWVGKGPYRGARIQYHARARMSLMWRPTAQIHIRLKEEKTRIRQHEERVEKQAKKAPWVHLPNRPVTAQRPYYSW